MDINGATAVVTDGGSGLGAATARQLAACGAKVAARQAHARHWSKSRVDRKNVERIRCQRQL